MKDFHRICQTCEWKKLGVCEENLSKHLGTNARSRNSSGGFLSSLFGPIRDLSHRSLLLVGVFLLIWSPNIDSAPTKYVEDIGRKPVDSIIGHIFKEKKNSAAVHIKNAMLAIERSDFVRARREAGRAKAYPQFADYGWAMESEARLAKSRYDLSKKRFESAIGEARSAVKGFNRLLVDFPHSPYIVRLKRNLADAEISIGVAYANLKNWNRALTHFESAFERHTKRSFSIYVPKPALQNFLIACQKKSRASCRGWVRKIVGLYPKNSPELALVERYFPGEMARTRPKAEYVRKKKSYRNLDKDRALLRDIMDLYFEKEYDDALEKLAQFEKDFPDSKHLTRALYWRAHILEADENNEEAKKLYTYLTGKYPLTYYGVLASFKIDKKVEDFIDARLPIADATDAYLYPEEKRRLERARKFIRVGLREFAALELRGMRHRSSLSTEFLSYLVHLNHLAENHFGSFIVLTDQFDRKGPEFSNTHTLRIVFPETYWGDIRKISSQVGIDPVLVHSLTKQESAFRKDAVSRSGALGLMQLMPFTALDVHPKAEQAKLVDPIMNIKLGSKYLSRVMKKFEGNIALSLAAYNAGPTRVKRWLKAYGKDRPFQMFEFVESIPFEETRGYVNGILRNYYWYSKRLQAKPIPNFDMFWENAELVKATIQ